MLIYALYMLGEAIHRADAAQGNDELADLHQHAGDVLFAGGRRAVAAGDDRAQPHQGRERHRRGALGAVGFNIGQILMAVAMLHTPQLIVTYLPVLMVSGVATGVLTGVVAQMVMKHLKVIEKKIKKIPGLARDSDLDKAILPPEGGRIALSANERIAEFLILLFARFAYVNKS